MEESGIARTSQHACEAKLASRGWQKIDAPNDQRHLVGDVIHRHRELIGPVAVAIANEQVA